MLQNIKIPVIIVDDMPMPRENLRLQLHGYDYIEIVGEASNIDDARKLIFKHRPQLIFLDIELPQKNGFELLNELKDIPEIEIDVIFVTAHSMYAEKSFEYFPFNFLTKPINPEKLKNVLDKYTKEKFLTGFSERVSEFNKKTRLLHFNDGSDNLWINPDEILFCKAEKNYTEIYLLKNEIQLVSSNIGAVEKILSSNNFMRIHRSYIVNITKVRKIKKRIGKVTLVDNPYNETPSVSKENIPLLIEKLQKD